MKKLLAITLCLTQLSLMGMYKAKALPKPKFGPEQPRAQESPKADLKKELDGVSSRLSQLERILLLSPQERATYDIEDVHVAGHLDDALKALETLKLKADPTDSIKVIRAITQQRVKALKGIQKLIDLLDKETDTLYEISSKYSRTTEQDREDVMKHLTRLNSLYNALINALENMDEVSEYTKKIQASQQKLVVVQNTIIL